MEYKISQNVEFGDRSFEVTAELGKEEDKNKKPAFWSNVIAIVLFIAITVLGFFAIRWIHPPMCFPVSVWSFVILILGYAAYTFVHELLRGLVLWIFGGAALKDLSLGIKLRQGMVFCISKVPVRIRRVRASLIVPFFVVFAPLFAYGLVAGDIVFVLGGALALTVSAADFFYMWLLREYKGSSFLLEERPKAAREDLKGYILKEDISVKNIDIEEE